ncbi:MAG TPA: hypothetical protein PLP94_04525 [Candidatus Saccharicenans sp.]|mgnify:FL=1|jgi:hypothetical protein|nr:hypothetical protein [Candidatus Saccharicenans sp.]HOL45466.1 hypothetical protein [Candidatus Saccharicenans sp.]HOM94382.1 hypothetical protein [Candidatus Saccharicenans sp.]HOT68907.1 hypothetical protein [Candidatus Saccharicenans sp.]HPC88135.1 hypothetical protein [Candidatus Saccharicenans sp.]
MKKLLKLLLILTTIFSMFLVGFHVGQEKEKARIPKFQDDQD